MIVGLNEFSSYFARHLFEAFPWLEQHGRLDPHPQADEGSLIVEYSPEPVRTDCQLWISTDDREVTIGFGMFHAHFDWPGDDEDEFREDPIVFLGDLVEERTLIEDWTKSGKWSGSSTLDRNEEPDTDDMAEDAVVYVRSWTGAHDRVIRHAGS